MNVPRSSTFLVGREDELRALEAAFEARAARPVILVGGEAGVGKSRLVAELASRVGSRGARTTVGCCVGLGGDGLPYGPFVDALGRYVEDLGDDAGEVVGSAREDLGALLPDLTTDHAGDGPRSQGRLHEAVRGLLDRAPSPLVCVLEDVHWADRSSLELLAYLASRLRHGRTALVATFRSDELHRRHPLVPVLAELARSQRTTRIDLERLDPARAGELVRAIRGDQASPAFVDAVAARSDGNPFLVEELLAVDAPGGATLPETLRDVLLARLGSLSEPARRALGIVAAVGRPADVELVAAAWSGSPEELDAAVREAMDGSILVVEAPAGRLAFRHALLGEAVAADLLPGERVRLHAALAAALAGRPDLATPSRAAAAAEIASHLFEAHDLDAACAAAIEAGDLAAGTRAYPEARRWYERALELLDRRPQPVMADVDRIRLLDAAAEASFHGGDAGRAVGLGRQAVAAAEAAADGPRTGYLVARLMEWAAVTGELEALAPLGERSLALVPPDPPTAARALLLLSLASARSVAGQRREALDLAREAERVAAACGVDGTVAGARSLVAAVLSGLGRADEAVEAADGAVELADRSRGAVEVALAHINRAAVYSNAGRYEDLPEVLAAAQRAVDREGLHDMSAAWLATDEVDLVAWQGRWSDAEALAGRMIDARPAPSPLAWHLIVRGQLRVRTGRLDEGERDLRAACDLRLGVEPDLRARALGHLAEALLERRDPRGALEVSREALAVLAATDEVPVRTHVLALGLRAAADLAEQAEARREPAGVAEAAAAAAPLLVDLRAAGAGRLVDGGGTDAQVVSRVAWGLAEDGRRTGAGDPGAWIAAAEALDEAGEPYLAALCRYRAAEASLAGAGDRALATSLLRRAHDLAARVGAAPLRRDVEALARRARLDLAGPAPAAAPAAGTRPGPTDRYGLSPREREVLALLLEGRTNREIGAALFISEKTAGVHVTHILDKLGVNSRGAAAAVAARGGLLDEPTGAPARPDAPPETLDLLMTDIVSSTALVEAIGDEAWGDLVRWHDRTIRATADRYGARVADRTGDGFFLVFPAATAAADCAVAIQRALAEHRRLHGFAPGVRIGLHHARVADVGGSYAGLGVHLAARITTAAGAGQIVASREFAAELGPRYPTSEPRAVALRGISAPIPVVTLDWRGVGG